MSIHANNIDLTGITTIYSPNDVDDYFTFFGNGVVMYENGINRWDVYHDGITTVMDTNVMKLYGNYDYQDYVTFENVPTVDGSRYPLVTCGDDDTRSWGDGVHISYTQYGIVIREVGTSNAISLLWD